MVTTRDLRRLLPWPVRLRLWLTSRVNHVGCWLVEHHHLRAARLLWRI
jgi:hypothetical protein